MMSHDNEKYIICVSTIVDALIVKISEDGMTFNNEKRIKCFVNHFSKYKLILLSIKLQKLYTSSQILEHYGMVPSFYEEEITKAVYEKFKEIL